MEEIDYIIEEQSQLLKRNGYTENQLNNREAEGHYKEQLKMAVQELLNQDNHLPYNEEFNIHLIGHFNQDKVLFTFCYEFNNIHNEINLKSVEAKLHDVQLLVPIHVGSDLWPSTELYGRIKLLSEPVKQSIEKENYDKIKSTIETEVQLLLKNGYSGSKTKSNFYQAFNYLKKFPNKLDFIIEGKANTKTDLMKYRLHYRFQPETCDLHLKSVFAQVGSAKATFLGTEQFPIPDAMEIGEFLSQKNQIQLAQTIIMKNHDTETVSKLRK